MRVPTPPRVAVANLATVAEQAGVGNDRHVHDGVSRVTCGRACSRAVRGAGRSTRAPATIDLLTEREREVMVLAGEGLSNDEIAARLVISPATAKTHVSRTMIKLGARDRAQLVVHAYEAGLIRPGWLA